MAVVHLCPRCRQPKPCKAHGIEGRPSPYRRGYGGKRWLEERRRFLDEHSWCSGPWSQCEKAGRLTLATDMDHDLPVSGPNDPTFWSGKFNALCSVCHRAKTRNEKLLTRV